MSFRCALALAIVAAACHKTPSFEDKLRDYNAAWADAVAKAKPSYDLLAAMRGRLATETPACSAPADPKALRISAADLAELTGAPVVKGDDPKRLPAPGLERGKWDTIPLLALNNPDRAVGEIGDIQREEAVADEAVSHASAFLVQAIDHYDPPKLTEGSGGGDYVGGTIAGRIVAFDPKGTPRCHYDYTAASSTGFFANGIGHYSGGPAVAIVVDLEANMAKSVIAATQLPYQPETP